MFFLIELTLTLAVIAQVAHSTRLYIEKRDSPLSVTLYAGENGVVEATVTNSGAEDLKLLKYGSLLDSAPVQKLNVFAQSSMLGVPCRSISNAYESPRLDGVIPWHNEIC